MTRLSIVSLAFLSFVLSSAARGAPAKLRDKVSELPATWKLEVTSPIRLVLPPDSADLALEEGVPVQVFSGGAVPGCRLASSEPAVQPEDLTLDPGELIAVSNLRYLGFWQGETLHPYRPAKFLAGIIGFDLPGERPPLKLSCHLGDTKAKDMTVEDLVRPFGYRWRVVIP